MRSEQKKIKFTKGMVTKSLEERNDLEAIADASAAEIINYVTTPYGGIRTRSGTKKVDKIPASKKVYFASVDDATSGSFINNNFMSGSLENLNDGNQIATFDLGKTRAEINLHFNKIRLDYEQPSLLATFASTGHRLEAVLSEVEVINAGLGFKGSLSVSGVVLSGTTAITPLLNSLGSITNIDFASAVYKYQPDNQPVVVSSELPACQIGLSVSTDNLNWSSEKLCNVGVDGANIKLEATNVRYLRMKFYGKALRTRLLIDEIFGLYDFVRMVPFVYNNEQKNLIVLTEKQIKIYDKNGLKNTLDIAEELWFKDLRSVKFAQNEDVIVFTEQNCKPRELRRTLVTTENPKGWLFQTYPLENIPFYNFNPTTKTAKTIGITPSDREGGVTITADSAVFDANSVGQQIDGGGGRFKITGFISTTKVNGYTIIPFFTTEKIASWQYISGYERVWSDSRGWPIACCYFQERLWFGGSKQRPSTIWGSRAGLYNNFENIGNYDNDAINRDMNTNSQIVNLLSNRGLQVFTSADEWVAPEESLTPNNFRLIKNTSNGSSITLTPKILNGVTLFVEKNGKSLLSYVYDYNQASYSSSNLGILSDLIANPVDMDIDSNSNLDEGDYLYIVLQDGRMIVTSLNFEQQVNASSIFQTSGQVLAVCNLVTETYLLVKRNEQVYLEVLNPQAKADGIFDVYVEEVIENLTDYEGQYLRIYSDEDYGKYQVVNGKIQMPYPINKRCKMGLVFQSVLQSLPINVGGRTVSIKKRISKAVIYAKDSKELKFCGVPIRSANNIFEVFSCTPYQLRTQFLIESEFNQIEILSVLIYINYGVG